MTGDDTGSTGSTDGAGSTDGLRSRDKNVRLDAAVAIGTAGDADRLDDLVSALASERDFFVREMLVWALVRIGPAAVPSLADLLGTGPVEAALAAVQVMGKLGDPAAVPALLDALPAADPGLRDRIVFSLGQIGDPATVPVLVALIGRTSEESTTTLVSAIESFGEDAFDELVARRSDPDAEVRAQVVDLLGFIGSPRAVAPLADAVGDHHPEVRVRALTALTGTLPAVSGPAHEQERRRATAAVREAVQDTDRRVQLLARRVLELSAAV
ncbi:MAG TPA: HEAT repeat domain-containing protein [Motilibacteraceae bacterium]|nr:HEAT repeat domain-containing protein [Motilibacteraceae bacterium]